MSILDTIINEVEKHIDRAIKRIVEKVNQNTKQIIMMQFDEFVKSQAKSSAATVGLLTNIANEITEIKEMFVAAQSNGVPLTEEQLVNAIAVQDTITEQILRAADSVALMSVGLKTPETPGTPESPTEPVPVEPGTDASEIEVPVTETPTDIGLEEVNDLSIEE